MGLCRLYQTQGLGCVGAACAVWDLRSSRVWGCQTCRYSELGDTHLDMNYNDGLNRGRKCFYSAGLPNLDV